jgi:hypothetical protein
VGAPFFTISANSAGLLENNIFKKGNNMTIENNENTTESILKIIFQIAYLQ